MERPTVVGSLSSLYFEDLEVGQTFVSSGRTVTEADVVGFAGLSGDFNPIHLDREITRSGMFGQRVAHGVLGLSMATGFLDRMGLFKTSMGAMLEIEEWKFVAPIFVNDTLHLEMTIESTRLTSKGTSGVVRRRLRLINQRDEVVQDGIIAVLILCRQPAQVEVNGS
ncbi:MaoC/PaaZ C-terminal domain-containing protein [Actinopolymorpha alba]|uniref:MaoC/PaaZ C-terminal domain-containing protein n=1 Tax=Actinopolymorpha alba TaxID=533267 RepID=UPI000685F2C5|nr:MaoC/PaaZ C-terminal domain-containing protein [Actinopolymorpha alba]